MTIRDAELGDLAAIHAIYDVEVLSGLSTFDTEPRDDRARREWFDLHQSAAYPVLVAVDGAAVVGWASLSPWSPRGAYRRTVEGSLFVAASHRRRGVGVALTAAILERARTAGHRVVLGRIEAGNEASRRLLLAAGFRSVGTMHRVGEKFGRVLDVEVLEFLV